MSSDLRQRLKRGFGANLYGRGVTIIIQLLGVPILLHAWGADLYGEWLILSAIPAYLSMTDFGFSQSAANDMTARAGRGDFVGMLSVFQSLAVLVYATATLGLGLVGILVSVLPVHDWMHFSHLSPTDTRWILLLLAAEILIKLADGVNDAGFRSTGRYAFHIVLYYSTSLLQQVSIWLIAIIGFGPVAAAAIMLILRCIITPSVARIVVSPASGLSYGFDHAKLSTLQTLIRPAVANLALPLAQAINIQGIVLVVGSMLGPTSVVLFSTLRTLTRLAVQLIFSVSHALEPEFARAWGNKNIPLLQRLYTQGFEFTFWLTVTAIFSLYLFGPWVYSVWTAGQTSLSLPLFYCLLLSAFFTVIWYSAFILLKAINGHLRATVWFAIMALATIVLAALFVRITKQIESVGLALVIMDVMMMFYLLSMIKSLFAFSAWSLLAIPFRSLIRSYKFMRQIDPL